LTFPDASDTYTKVTLEVTKSLKGGFPVGTKVDFEEWGGITTSAARLKNCDCLNRPPTTAERTTRVQVLFEGARPAQVGDDIVYFANKADANHLPGDYYVPFHVLVGKLLVTGGVAKRYVPAGMDGSFGPALAMPVGELERQATAALVQRTTR
jgi:hypothetical protein